MKSFFKSQYSIEDLEQFRDEYGFIDLSKAEVEFSEETREHAGNPYRIKNWVDFGGRKVLIKGETTDNDKNNGMYSELIIEEICNKVGIETAHYDLVKYLDENGEVSYGVLSESIVDTEKGESLISLHDLIGDEKNPIDINTIDYDFTISALREFMNKQGYDEEITEKLILDYKKILIFTIATLDEDKHTENFSFITSIDENGKQNIRLAPNYDSEASLLLLTDTQTTQILVNEDGLDMGLLESSVRSVDPKIGVILSEDEGGLESIWEDTIESLIEDDEVYDYYRDEILSVIDMDEILENVEKRIKAPLPENVKVLAKYSYQIRKEDMQKTMGLEQQEYDVNDLLKSMINRGIKNEGIRTGEQVQVGKNMEKNMKENDEISIDSILGNLFDNR